jgi:hypothetical protein
MVVMLSLICSKFVGAVPTAKAPHVMESPVKRDEAPLANEQKFLIKKQV